MANAKNKSQTNKVFLGIIVILIAWLVYLELQVNSLKKEVATLSSEGSQVGLFPPPKLISPFSDLSRQHGWDPFNDDWDPFSEIDRIQKEMNRMFQNSFGRGQSRFNLFSKKRAFDLKTDIGETDSQYIIKINIAGMDKANINVEAKNDVLIVSGERNEFKEENDKDRFFRRERNFDYFSRTVPLPENADTNNMTTQYKNGVLTVKVAKKKGVPQKDKNTLKINVS